jgi:S1-C subfamily serine protease
MQTFSSPCVAMTIAIGNPLGQERTVTNRIVSAIGRTIDDSGNPYAISGAIQSEAPHKRSQS